MANVNGNDAANTLEGFSTDDLIKGFFGADTIDGHGGQDIIYGNQDNDLIDGGSGDDTAYGGQNDDYISGAEGRDLLYGNFGDDTISGSENQDTIYGGQGEDLICGGDDNDVLYGNRDQDTLFGNADNDTLYGGYDGAADKLDGNSENDVVYGQGGDDTICQAENYSCGGTGNDTLYGGAGNDLIFHGDGADHDQLWGDGGPFQPGETNGADTFDFEGYSHCCDTENHGVFGVDDGNTERIMDFETGKDEIDVNICEDTDVFYTEIQNSGVNDVADAIAFVQSNESFELEEDDDLVNFVFIAGAEHGFLLVNNDGDDEWNCCNGDFVIVLQNLNSTADFSAGDIEADFHS